MPDKGKIRRFYEVDCGLCINAQVSFATDLRGAEQSFRSEGWKKTVDHGWVCDRKHEPKDEDDGG